MNCGEHPNVAAGAPPPAQAGWKQRISRTVRDQLTRGVSPRKVSLTLAMGMTIGVFPIVGATTLLCFLTAMFLRLNHPVIQTANWLVAWAQLPLVLVFVRLGEWIAGADPFPFSPSELTTQFQAGPAEFLRRFGVTGLHGILGWSLTAPLAAFAIYVASIPTTVRMTKRMNHEGGLS